MGDSRLFVITISRVSTRIEKFLEEFLDKYLEKYLEKFLVKICRKISHTNFDYYFSLGNPSYKDLSHQPLEGHIELIHKFQWLAIFFHSLGYFFLVELLVLPLEFFRQS